MFEGWFGLGAGMFESRNRARSRVCLKGGLVSEQGMFKSRNRARSRARSRVCYSC